MKLKDLADKYKLNCIEDEGLVEHLYLCPKGYPTIGIGFRLINSEGAKKLPWH